MIQRTREVFLTELIAELQPLYPQLQNHSKIEWLAHPKSVWPEADILIDTSSRRFIIEYDEDCDPVRSIIKYWPVIDTNTKVPLTVIGIWRRGQTTGKGYGELAEWVGTKLMGQYSPHFIYKFVERKDESTKSLTEKVTQIITSTV